MTKCLHRPPGQMGHKPLDCYPQRRHHDGNEVQQSAERNVSAVDSSGGSGRSGMTAPAAGGQAMPTDERNANRRAKNYDYYRRGNPLTVGAAGADDGYHHDQPDHNNDNESPRHHQHHQQHCDYPHNNNHRHHRQQPHGHDDRPCMSGKGSMLGTGSTTDGATSEGRPGGSKSKDPMRSSSCKGNSKGGPLSSNNPSGKRR